MEACKEKEVDSRGSVGRWCCFTQWPRGPTWAVETRTAPKRKALPPRQPPRSRGLPRLRAPPPVEAASQESGQAAVASTSHRGLGSPMAEFTLTVPFLSYVDAEVARRYLMAGAETYHGRVHWDLRVADSELFIRLTAEDTDLLQISTASMLHRLAIVVQTMQHFVPQFRSKPQSQEEN